MRLRLRLSETGKLQRAQHPAKL